MLFVEENRARALAVLARPLFPSAVQLAVTDPTDAPTGLTTFESDQIANAVDKRRREFAAGRRAARMALVTMGHPSVHLPIGENRAPIWPDGVVGSISHSDTICIAVTAPSRQIAAIGVDVEDDRLLSPELEPLICTPTEREWLARHPKHHRRRMGMLVFSAKEAAFKCQFALSHRMLGFDALEIHLSDDIGHFEARFTQEAGPFPENTVLHGKFVTGHDMILTAVTLRR